ncbi:asparagine synthase-related protein [Halobellus marinus]|uniref:asparagine synthase-related protein n=1 Tax=Halobellus TaxID=1073986 RepID=UPI0028A97825|nr:asparagine synthase-related protein [Halobellus sp. DFY28]
MTGLCAAYGDSASVRDTKQLAEVMDYRALGGYDCISFSDCTLCHLHYNSTDKPHIDSQPFVEDSAAITLDGSIDNRSEVQDILRQHSTTTYANLTDAEFLLSAYRELGADSFNHIYGSYVGVIYDRTTNKTIIFRGLSGGRHLYYAKEVRGNTTLIASEVEALLQHQAVNSTVHKQSVSNYISGSISRQPISFHSSIERLRQGEYVVISGNETSHHRVVANDDPVDDSGGYCASQLRTQITQAISDRAKSKKSAGVMLSGGLDSSAIAAEMARQKGSQSVKGYSLIFPDEESIDETSNIRSLTQSSNIECIDLRKSVKQLFDEYNPFRYTFGHPCIDMSLPIFEAIFDRASADNIDILQTGIGGNLHDGNRLFYSDLSSLGEYQKIAQISNEDSVSALTIILYALLPSIFSTTRAITEIDKLNSSPPSLHENVLPTHMERFSRLETLRTYINLTNPYMDYALDACRQVALSHGIELQHPFLDGRILKALFQTHPADRFKNGYWKATFRDAVRNLLPQEIVRTPVSENTYNRISEQFSKLYIQEMDTERQAGRNTSSQEEVWRRICATEWVREVSVNGEIDTPLS